MKIFYYDHFSFFLPEGHRFPASKYGRLRDRVKTAGIVSMEDLVVPSAASFTQLARAHDVNYLNKVQDGLLDPNEIRRIGLPWSPELVNRAAYSVGATIAASRIALREGVSATLGGGTHHACYAEGQGFCLYNDVVTAARAMQAEGRVKKILIIDCDVHQGNGTADITVNDPTIFAFSIHGEKNFPFRKIPGDLDIGLADGIGDEAYLAALENGLMKAFEQIKADLAIFLAGADVHQHDRLGRLSLTKAGIRDRDHLVLQKCRDARIPIVVTMAGGYGRNIEDTVDIHFQTIQTAVEFAR